MKDIISNKFAMLLLEKGKTDWCSFLFFPTFWLKVYLWLIMEAWASYCISLMSKVFQKPISQTQVIGRWHLACMSWFLTKSNLWLKVLNSFPFPMMKSLLINNHGFPFMLTLLKIGNEFHYCYPCSEWLMGPLLILWSAF